MMNIKQFLFSGTMALSVCIAVSCLSVIVSVQGQTLHPFWYPSICAPPNQTILDPALPAATKMPQLPYIPDTFQLRVEANIIDKQTTWSAEEYYDDNNNRAALRLLRNKSMDYMIFDYTNNQIIYDVNGNCSVTTLNRDPYGNEIISGMKASGGGGGIPHIYTTSSALHFAKSNGLAGYLTANNMPETILIFMPKHSETFRKHVYKGTKIVRGINCDWWQSCMYWPNLAANFTLDYYFSAYNWTAPDLSNQVPVLAEIQGVTLGAIPFHHTYEYFDYRSHIWDSDSVFDTPQGKVCPDRKQTRKVPVLSGQYSYREEIVDTMNLAVSQAAVYYDYTYSLVRFDYTPPFSRYPYYATNPVSEIHDYSSGIAYAIDNYLGNCTMIPIQNTTFDGSIQMSVSANQSEQFYVHMKSPSKLFYLDNTTYSYEGMRVVRGILCDVFISKRTDFHLPNYPNFTSTFEFYFMNSEWIASNSLGAKSKANTDTPVQLKITTPNWVGYQAMYNIYSFDSEDQSYNRFSIAQCFNDSSKKTCKIEFPGQSNDSLVGYQTRFIRQITNRISSIANISHIRIQNGQFHADLDRFHFVATLLELPPPIGTRQTASLDLPLADAWKSLRKDVQSGNFNITVVINGKPTAFKAASIDDYVLQNAGCPTTELTSSSPSPCISKPLKSENPSPSSDKRLSTGQVVGVAFGTFVMGILITIFAYAGFAKIQRKLKVTKVQDMKLH